MEIVDRSSSRTVVERKDIEAVAGVTDPVLSMLEKQHGVEPVMVVIAMSLILRLGGIEEARKVLDQVADQVEFSSATDEAADG